MLSKIIENVDTVSDNLLSFVGQILIQEHNFTQAYEVLSKIVDKTNDLKIKAGYASALAENDVKAAADYIEKIDFAYPQLENERNVHELVETALDQHKQAARKRDKKVDGKVEETKKGGKIFIPKAKSNKKIRYPKNFDPANPGPMPNPERWIPKWQRTKGRKKLRMKGPQGDVQNIGIHSKKGVSTANMEAAGSNTSKRKK